MGSMNCDGASVSLSLRVSAYLQTKWTQSKKKMVHHFGTKQSAVGDSSR